jgi:hypothetical protein
MPDSLMQNQTAVFGAALFVVKKNLSLPSGYRDTVSLAQRSSPQPFGQSTALPLVLDNLSIVPEA